ncbi:3-hydroxybutyryl-CoA dehydrogenase [Ectothiorhodospiraceae bacterium BW-2]|nr:3-hydroxybutyryl-CoA dehydrogenase [Ectothiorhodospiraceae bacterium BW-2]
MNQNRVGVVGAGVMGSGVAQNLAQSGYEVVLIDISEEVLSKTRQEISNNVRFSAFYAKDKSKVEPVETVLARIDFTTDYSQLKDVYFVVENASEKWEVKQAVYPLIDQYAPAEARVAADTSCFSITRLASLTQRADKIIGMHFMNPVPMKPTVEVIKGYHTSEETIKIGLDFLASFGKEGIVVNDLPGFVSNRVLMLTVNEAIYLLHEGVASAQQVDEIFRKCFGHKMGPLETADLIGLDTILYSVEVLWESYNDSKYRPCPLLKKMVDAGLLGRKSGEGFYQYQGGMKK